MEWFFFMRKKWKKNSIFKLVERERLYVGTFKIGNSSKPTENHIINVEKAKEAEEILEAAKLKEYLPNNEVIIANYSNNVEEDVEEDFIISSKR